MAIKIKKNFLITLLKNFLLYFPALKFTYLLTYLDSESIFTGTLFY